MFICKRCGYVQDRGGYCEWCKHEYLLSVRKGDDPKAALATYQAAYNLGVVCPTSAYLREGLRDANVILENIEKENERAAEHAKTARLARAQLARRVLG